MALIADGVSDEKTNKTQIKWTENSAVSPGRAQLTLWPGTAPQCPPVALVFLACYSLAEVSAVKDQSLKSIGCPVCQSKGKLHSADGCHAVYLNSLCHRTVDLDWRIGPKTIPELHFTPLHKHLFSQNCEGWHFPNKCFFAMMHVISCLCFILHEENLHYFPLNRSNRRPLL